MKTACLHHNDSDGWGSAYSLWKALKATNELMFIEVQYGQEPPYEALRTFGPDQVFIVDFCYKADVLKELGSEFSSVVLVDHHASALREYAGYVESAAVKLSDGSTCIVDVNDLKTVSAYSWSNAKHGGAMAYVLNSGRRNPKHIYMHRLILGATDPHQHVDHINRNPLDNRRCNLRFASKQQNAFNMRRNPDRKGVTPHFRGTQKWKAQIMKDGVQHHLGLFSTVEEAQSAYDAAAISMFGEFAHTNHGCASEPLPSNVRLVLNTDFSGCVLTWQHFFPEEEIPEILLYVQDRDLWKFELENSMEINAYIASLPNDFEEWDQFYTPEAYDSGRAIIRLQEKAIERRLKDVRMVEIAGHTVPCVNASENISELGSAMCEAYPDAPFSMSYCDRGDGKRSYSLRSRNGFDVSEVAKAFGGGGHPSSAAFTAEAPAVFQGAE